MEWAKERAAFLTEQEKPENRNISINFSHSSLITKNYRYTFNAGYLFLQRIFYDPGSDKICASIQKNADWPFNLTEILQKLCYNRILEPRSKTLLQQPDSDVLQMYRAPDVLCENFEAIQSELYRNTLKLGERKTGVIY